jgi:glycerophosphoryl diester phosphodiesterase
MDMTPEPQSFADLVLAIILEYNLQNRVLIQSFDVRPLQYIRKQYPAIKISYLLSKNTPLTLEQNLAKLGFIPQVLSPEYPMVTEQMVKTARKHKMAIIPWTIDSEADMRKYIGMGVDGIITNYPDLLLKLLSRQ